MFERKNVAVWIYHGFRKGGLCDVHLLQMCECECECLCLLTLKDIFDERAQSKKEKKMCQACVSHTCQTKSNNEKAYALHKSTRGWHENDDDSDDDDTETAIIWWDLLCFFSMLLPFTRDYFLAKSHNAIRSILLKKKDERNEKKAKIVYLLRHTLWSALVHCTEML